MPEVYMVKVYIAWTFQKLISTHACPQNSEFPKDEFEQHKLKMRYFFPTSNVYSFNLV